jgi:hypothetical protein
MIRGVAGTDPVLDISLGDWIGTVDGLVRASIEKPQTWHLLRRVFGCEDGVRLRFFLVDGPTR